MRRMQNAVALVAICLVVFVLSSSASQVSSAWHQCSSFEEDVPRGVSATALACTDVSRQKEISSIALYRIEIPPKQRISPTELDANELYYVESGSVVIFDAQSGREERVDQGAQILLEFAFFEDYEDPLYYGLRNDGAESAWLLQVRWVHHEIATQGAPILEYPLVATAQPTELFDLQAYAVSGYDQIVLARMTLEPGADLGYHTHPGGVISVVESGTLWIEHHSPENPLPDPVSYQPSPGEVLLSAPGSIQVSQGQYVVSPLSMPHREWNGGDVPVTYLVVGFVRGVDPFIGQDSLIELHSAQCPDGYAQGNESSECHHLGRGEVTFDIHGAPGIGVAEEYPLPRVLSGDEGMGPFVIKFRGLPAGTYDFGVANGSERDSASVYCSGGPNRQVFVATTISESDRVAIDVPPAAHIVCDWYHVNGDS